MTIHPDGDCVTVRNLEFAWEPGAPILSIPSLSIKHGERLFLEGPSGGGKSTLLGLVAGVLAPTSGEISVEQHPFHKMTAAARDHVRADALGVIFQQFNLAPYLDLVENVLLPCRFSRARAARVGATQQQRQAKARALLDRLGLDGHAQSKNTTAELSVGQQQRVAAARALIGSPSLIVADEPTSALDAQTRDGFINTLLSEAQDAAILFVSHDAALAKHFDRHLKMHDLNTSSVQMPPASEARQ